MFTILNMINYFTGKYIPIYILILLTVGIYYYIINNLFINTINGDNIINLDNNIVYIVMIILILLIDIVSITMIFAYGDTVIKNNVKKIKLKNIVSSEKKLSKSKSKSKSETNEKQSINVQEPNSEQQLISSPVISEPEIISLYDINKDLQTINTY